MFIQLHDGPEMPYGTKKYPYPRRNGPIMPVRYAEDPFAPGSPVMQTTPYKLLAQSEGIILPDALYPANVEGFKKALESLETLYKNFVENRKKTPQEITKTPGMAEGLTLLAAAKAASAVVKLLTTAARGIAVNLARQNITTQYNNNEFNVKNLNTLNPKQISNEITRIDSALETTPKLNVPKKMALSRFRLVYQQRFDQVTGGGGISNLPSWALPAAVGLGALLLLRK